MTRDEFRALMTAAGVDRPRLAAAMRVSERAVKSWWYGERPIPPAAAAVLAAIARGRVVANAVERDLIDTITAERQRRVAAEIRLRDARINARRRQGPVEAYVAAVDTFCRSCEPEGRCRDGTCPLRPVSPLPLAVARTA